MRCWFCILLLFLVFTPVSWAAEITLATFNCFWLFDDVPPHQNVLTTRRGGQTYQQALTGIAQVIHQVGADAIALQEIENADVLEDLRQEVIQLGTTYPHAWIRCRH